jgi:hypothetical protein
MTDDLELPSAAAPLVEFTPDFTPDPDLDALYRQAVAAAREFGWTLPLRKEFED